MQMFRLAASTAALLAVAPVTLVAQVPPGAPATDWDRIRAEYSVSVLREYNSLINDWRAHFEDGSAPRSADYYSEAAWFFVDGVPPMQGRDSIRNYLESIKGELVEIRTGLADFVASDNLAYATGPLLYRYREESGAVRSIVGHHVTVLTREGRRWRIRSQVLSWEGQPADG
jgi:ketosteroid isomerase-like protein